MKKVLVIGPLPPPTGGMETVMEQMSSLKFKNYKLIIFNTNKKNIIKSNLIINVINFIYRCLKLICIHIFMRPDIIHIHTASNMSFWQSSVFQKISQLFCKKTVMHIHGAEFKIFYKSQPQLIKNILNHTSIIIVLSDSWKNYFKSITNNNNIVVVKNCVRNNNIIKPSKIFRKKTKEILFLGRVCQRKGIYDLLKAIPKVDNNTSFTIVGPLEDKDKVIQMLNKYNINNRCNIIGEVFGEAKYKYLKSADAYVLPSYNEGLPVAILEAMNFGLPIISTRVGAIPEVVSKNNGILIKPGQVIKLSNAINKLIRSPKIMKQMSENNRRKIKAEYTIENFQNNILEIYENVTNKL